MSSLTFFLPPYSGGIHKIERKSEAVIRGVYAIASGPCYVGNNISILSNQGIDEMTSPHWDDQQQQSAAVHFPLRLFAKEGPEPGRLATLPCHSH